MPTCTISFLFPDAVEYSVHSPTSHLKPIDEKDIAVLFTHCAGEGANAGKGSGTEGTGLFFVSFPYTSFNIVFCHYSNASSSLKPFLISFQVDDEEDAETAANSRILENWENMLDVSNDHVPKSHRRRNKKRSVEKKLKIGAE